MLGLEKRALTAHWCASHDQALGIFRFEKHGVDIGKEIEAGAIDEDLHAARHWSVVHSAIRCLISVPQAFQIVEYLFLIIYMTKRRQLAKLAPSSEIC